MTKKKICLILALIMTLGVLASCGNKGEYAAPAGYVMASDEKNDFYFYVPDSWTIDYTTAAVGAYCSKNDPSSVSMMAWELEYSDTTVDDWWEINRPEIENVFTDFNLESEENITIDGLYAREYVYTAKLGEFEYKYLQAACIKSSTVYLFTYTSTADSYDAHIDAVNELIGFIRLK